MAIKNEQRITHLLKSISCPFLKSCTLSEVIVQKDYRMRLYEWLFFKLEENLGVGPTILSDQPLQNSKPHCSKKNSFNRSGLGSSAAFWGLIREKGLEARFFDQVT
jgi:hypothetical protein